MKYTSMCRIETVLIRERKEAFNIQTCSPREVCNAFRFIADKPQESLYIVCLNSKNRIIGYSEIAKGGLNSCAIDMRELVRIAILVNAASVIILHNHPSGDSEPSGDDISITEKAKNALTMFGITLLDHIIIGDENFTSLFKKGLIRTTEVQQ